MTKSSRSISIAHNHDKPNLSKGQKTFNSLIKQIDKRRKRLSDWELVTPHYQRQYVNDRLPLMQTMKGLQIRMAHCLDQRYDQLTKAERRKIKTLILDLTTELIDQSDNDEDTQTLKAIHDKYSPTDYDSQMAEDVGDMKSMLEAMFGVDLGDDADLKSPQDLMQRAKEHFEQAQAEYEAEQEAELARRNTRNTRRTSRKKSSQQQVAEARAQERQEQINLSIREVYRKLASALHPDREPDVAERERKTLLMQRVNEAYQKNNLLQLLELQLQLEHIDQHALNNISEDRLKHYNTILKEQVAELDREILHVESAFRYNYDMDPFSPIAPDTVMKSIAADLKELRLGIQSIEHDLAVFEDLKSMKRWIKEHRAVFERRDDFDFNPF